MKRTSPFFPPSLPLSSPTRGVRWGGRKGGGRLQIAKYMLYSHCVHSPPKQRYSISLSSSKNDVTPQYHVSALQPVTRG